MKVAAVVTLIIFTSLSTFTLAAKTTQGFHQLMFVGAVVKAPCTVNQDKRELTFSCLSNVATGVEVEKYDVTSLNPLAPLRSKYKTIALSSLKNKPGLAKVTVAYN
ncbi:TPA: hypothetical protein ACGD2U_004489 [Aeromonas veronii]|uniref:Type 1 fimbrial protein n=1 Tax=Aeromonas veronii TaxID=654 RepID=A0A3A9IFR9_AERVE|nr:hypothetical protein [Aeromonas veronii]RKJ86469.1 hypothetical protein D6R50_19680 [Aeromonas veronii]RKJ89735.1 hypothetical protein D6R50_10890 [Aeromonas veronii]